jgi:hypothetical protein
MSPVSPIRLKALVEQNALVELEPTDGIAVRLPVRLRLLEARGTLEPADAEIHPEDLVTLTAPLPTATGHAELTAQDQGLRSRLAQLREQKLGVAALDDAFLIHCDDDGHATLRRCTGELERLLPCPVTGRIHLGPNQLVVTWGLDRLDAVLHLWERIHALRIGA